MGVSLPDEGDTKEKTTTREGQESGNMEQQSVG